VEGENGKSKIEDRAAPEPPSSLFNPPLSPKHA
jgi:hypothetical protein